MTGETATFTAADDHDADSHYRVTLVATDPDGLDDSTTISIHPTTTTLDLLSEPAADAPVSYGGSEGTTPVSRTTAVGYRTTVSAAFAYERQGLHYVFDRWSDGGARSHEITVPSSASALTAIYREDKAALRPAMSSSNYNSSLTPEKANDGNSETRWSSAKGLDNQWWQVDLGAVRQVDTVELNWEAAYAKTYKILTSTDGTNFTEAASETASSAGLVTTTFAARDARYVRVLGLTRGTIYGFSFWDARVHGPQD